MNIIAWAMFVIAFVTLTGCASAPQSSAVKIGIDGMRSVTIQNKTTLSLYVEVEGWTGFQEVKPLNQRDIDAGSGKTVVIRARTIKNGLRMGCTRVPYSVDFGQCQKKFNKTGIIVVDWNDFPTAKPE